jgi:predicted lipoprotein with Yx(FWY)xxD motif
VLVNSKGHTLYLFSKDRRDKSTCYRGCATLWPPLLKHGKPTLGPGVNKALLGTTRRRNGTRQLTYNKHPLYSYKRDTDAGETKGEGRNAFGAKWYAVSRKGRAVKPASASGSSSGGFVTRVGQQLYLDGSPYRFVGFNVWRANVASWNRPPNTGYDVNDGTTLDQTLKGIDANGGRMNVIRVWFFQQFALNSAGDPTPSPSYNWAAFDKTLQVAQAEGFKVIATLADEWSYEGQPTKTASWYSSGYKTTVEPYEAFPYRQFVQDVVTRYKNNPTILAWELVNEPGDRNSDGTCPSDAAQTLSAFVHDVGGMIKSIDPNHLVSLGASGNGMCGTNGSDYQTVMSDPSIDLCSFHDYYGATDITAYNTYNGLNVRVQQCATLDKPIYIGEMGIHSSLSPCSGNLACRASYLGQKLAAAFSDRGFVGYLPWQYDQRGQSPTGDDYVYSPGDPSLTTLNAYTQ